MHIHARIHHWVLWWFYVGVACGAVAVVNIFGRNLSGAQDRLILAIGAAHWLLGGLVCYACEGIHIERPQQPTRSVLQKAAKPATREQNEWHAASDFLLPGNRKSLLPERPARH